MINLTDLAYSKIKELLTKRGKGVGIKIGVKTTGCSGLAYVLEYIDKVDYDPTIILAGVKDVAIVIDKKSEPYLKGLTIDYVKKGLNEGFEFINPNERDRCGCGESFRI